MFWLINIYNLIVQLLLVNFFLSSIFSDFSHFCVSLRDLDQACMDAVAALLRGLPLQPEESDRGDLMEAKSQLFLKYFTLFMNLLNDCTDVSEIEKEVGARSRVGVAVGVGVGAVAVAASRLANLRNSTIQV